MLRNAEVKGCEKILVNLHTGKILGWNANFVKQMMGVKKLPSNIEWMDIHDYIYITDPHRKTIVRTANEVFGNMDMKQLKAQFGELWK